MERPCAAEMSKHAFDPSLTISYFGGKTVRFWFLFPRETFPFLIQRLHIPFKERGTKSNDIS